ncbi:gliding motility-associated C-terminal domain-containing protein [Pedobacter sp. P351]|uniref:gliding motility-associated C-terminal domain-containing protein n=1 Tax=Pedobacter superstes TaxID=3133441 RepID=UPI0030A2B5A3
MVLKNILLISGFICTQSLAYGQIVTECPQNIGFENGTLNNWECYTGYITETGRNVPGVQRPAVVNVAPSSPLNGTHTLISKGHTDPFGGFSLDAPNGSDYVIKLGNEINGRGAEAISFTINVPSNVPAYSVIFNYAVVFENPDHEFDEQPKFMVRVIDESTNTFTECGSFEFTAPGLGGGIPGFETAPISFGDSILYKPWSPVMVNLSNYLGRTIRLEFTTNDCSRGRHFGYAYIDFNENCSIPILGNITCPDTDAITLTTIPGFSQYNWFNAATSESLGSGDQLKLSPAPQPGTVIGVNLTPFAGLGCSQTLYTTITGMYMTVNNPPEKCKSIDITSTSVTVGNSSDLTYTYWKDPKASVPLPDPKHILVDGTYYIKGQSSSGCTMISPVVVTLTKLKPISIIQPPTLSFPESFDLTKTFIAEQGINYSYWSNPEATVGLKEPSKIRRGGTFYIKGENSEGCASIAQVNVSITLPDFFIPNAFTPNGDGINDVFTIVVKNKIAIKNLKIFNRWGQVIYQTSDIDDYWDGLKENINVPSGVYYWIIEGDEKLQFFKKSGYVTVLR